MQGRSTAGSATAAPSDEAMGYGVSPAYNSGGGGSGSGSGSVPFISSITSGLQLTQTETAGVNGATQNKYTVTGDVPIGTIMQVELGNPQQNITWVGGTDISGYLAASSDDAAPQVLTVSQNVDTHGAAYTFIVDSNPHHYKVEVTTASGMATLEFDSKAPVQMSLAQDNNPTPMQLPTDPSRVILADPAKNNDLIAFKPTTETDANWGGSFMIMQVAYPHRSYTDANNVKHSNIGGPWVDNGGTGQNLTLGTELAEGRGVTYWALDKNTPDPFPGQHVYQDGGLVVGALDPANDQAAGIGEPPPPVGPPVMESFTTYLMYRPSPHAPMAENINKALAFEDAVWVPLGKINWGWGVQLTKNNGIWSIVAGTAVSSIGPYVPVTSTSDWPVWGSRTSDHDYN